MFDGFGNAVVRIAPDSTTPPRRVTCRLDDAIVTRGMPRSTRLDHALPPPRRLAGDVFQPRDPFAPLIVVLFDPASQRK